MSDREVFEYHGYEEQCKHITGELQELIIAIYKYELTKGNRNPLPIWNNICEEIADIEFMLNQIKEYYLIQEDNINAWKDFKRKRESKRIKEGYYEKKES